MSEILPIIGRGLVRFANRVVNQKGATVLEYDPLRMLKRKG